MCFFHGERLLALIRFSPVSVMQKQVEFLALGILEDHNLNLYSSLFQQPHLFSTYYMAGIGRHVVLGRGAGKAEKMQRCTRHSLLSLCSSRETQTI